MDVLEYTHLQKELQSLLNSTVNEQDVYGIKRFDTIVVRI